MSAAWVAVFVVVWRIGNMGKLNEVEWGAEGFGERLSGINN